MYWFCPILWVFLLGFLGQVIFTGMFLIHCFFLERDGKHYVQMVFWILVLGGSLMLLVCVGYHPGPSIRCSATLVGCGGIAIPL